MTDKLKPYSYGTLNAEELRVLMYMCKEAMDMEAFHVPNVPPHHLFYGAMYYKLQEMKDKLTPRDKLE